MKQRLLGMMKSVANTYALNQVNPNGIWLLICIAALIRLVFIGLMDLLPEEAYYWNYAQHLDIVYLDHPPMAAWLIYLSEAVLGKSEFAVRLPAFLGWFLFAYFMYRLIANLFDKSTAVRALLLIAVLPIYLSVGFLMTPDAPFYIAWAGCLYFLERALLAGKSKAWIGIGVCVGLGLLSKYTMGLIVPATIVFLVADKDSRQWFLRPQPYVAALIATLLFLPVIYWNFAHDWASFVFQGSRRWAGGIDFNLHILIGSMLILITPLGVIEAVRALAGCLKHLGTAEPDKTSADTRRKLFMSVFTLVPLTVFILHSLQGQPKLNWTGPVWMAILPMIAWGMHRISTETSGWWVRLNSRVWTPAAIILLIFYTTGLGYIVAGIPGAPVVSGMPVPIAWRELGNKVEQLETRLKSTTGSEPLIVGLDKYWIASEVSFYDAEDGDSLPEVAGENIVGGNSLMWNLWVPANTVKSRNALLISFTENKLGQPWITRRFAQLGEVSKKILHNGNGEIGHFFWRIGYDYRN